MSTSYPIPSNAPSIEKVGAAAYVLRQYAETLADIERTFDGGLTRELRGFFGDGPTVVSVGADVRARLAALDADPGREFGPFAQ